MDSEAITERIASILSHYDLSAAAFADSIQVQRSNISHILNGRNKPSLDFVMKVVGAYPEVDLYWLLYGQGSFPKEEVTASVAEIAKADIAPIAVTPEAPDKPNTIPVSQNEQPPVKQGAIVERVLIFYTDGTFSSYDPRK